MPASRHGVKSSREFPTFIPPNRFDRQLTRWKKACVGGFARKNQTFSANRMEEYLSNGRPEKCRGGWRV
jgi:hypothetical protein